ncbi:VapE domain-containing protein [Candidatus Palauibacter sp.]|uniref:VapE domain-containing protein n=1 Tax=Candidatus Palauibacter sp. TaxID=3101350 RepID=UPI003B02E44C
MPTRPRQGEQDDERKKAHRRLSTIVDATVQDLRWKFRRVLPEDVLEARPPGEGWQGFERNVEDEFAGLVRLHAEALSSGKKGRTPAVSAIAVRQLILGAGLAATVNPALEWACSIIPSPPEKDAVQVILDECARFWSFEQGPVSRWVLPAVLVGVLDRIRRPGRLQKTMPVLCGPADSGKSTFLAHLLPSRLRGRFNPNIPLAFGDDSDFAVSMLGQILGEVSEMTGMRKAEVEQVKARLGRGSDRIRRKYGRDFVTLPRSCRLVGSTNRNNAFLSNDSALRSRFIVMHVRPARARPNVREVLEETGVRERLWGAAMALAFAGFDCDQVPFELLARARESTSRFVRRPDVLDEAVGELDRDEAYTMRDVLRLGDLPLGKDRAMAPVLRRHGWESVPRRVEGRVVRRWVWRP